MYIHTYTKATPQEIRALDGRKLDDFSKLRRKKVKINKSLTSQELAPCIHKPRIPVIGPQAEEICIYFQGQPH